MQERWKRPNSARTPKPRRNKRQERGLKPRQRPKRSLSREPKPRRLHRQRQTRGSRPKSTRNKRHPRGQKHSRKAQPPQSEERRPAPLLRERYSPELEQTKKPGLLHRPEWQFTPGQYSTPMRRQTQSPCEQ